jgi:hypothetical protein
VINTALEIVNIPLNKLVASPLNVRRTGGQTIDELAASIHAVVRLNCTHFSRSFFCVDVTSEPAIRP